MKNKPGSWLLHITGCVAFLSLPVLLSPDVSWNFHFLRLPPFQEDFISYTLLLLFFYLNYFILIPRLYFRQKIFFYAGCVVLSYVIIAVLPHVLIPGGHNWRANAIQRSEIFAPPGNSFHTQPDQQPGSIQPPQDNHFNRQPPPGPGRGILSKLPRFEYLFQFMMVLVLSAMIRVNNRLKQTEKEKVNAELSYLKAQINPHFLFNTLNSIYSSAIEENADNTANAVVKLSGMMRYVISEANHQYVSLEKELSYICDYIELQKIRLGETVQLLYNVSGSPLNKQIAPLILISFIENAFKHGVNPEQDSSIDIEIIIDEHTLHMTVLNNKVKTAGNNESKNNVGLENTSNRLKLLYPSKHELVIKEDEKEYMVLLKINLQ